MAHSYRPLVRFHWRAGTRVALRASAIGNGIVVFAIGSTPEPRVTLHVLTLELMARGAGSQGRMLFAGFCVALAAAAAPRVNLGAGVWMKSLPAGRDTQRHAAHTALVLAQLSAFVLLALAAVATSAAYGAHLSPAKLVGGLLIIAAAAFAALPELSLAPRAIAVAALVAAMPGTWIGDTIAPVLLLGADVAARYSTPARAVAKRWGTTPRVSSRLGAFELWMRLSWRAVPLRRVLALPMLSSVFIAFAYFINLHNPEVSRLTLNRATMMCGGLVVAAFASGLANLFLQSRPAWPWVRSLPWSCAERACIDAVMFGVPLFVVPISVIPLGVKPAVVLACLVPAAGAFGAAALRAGAGRQTGAAGEAFTIVFLLSLVVALWPGLAVVALALAPLAIGWAVVRERNARVSAWVELHHDAAGDPGWLTNR